MSSVTVTDLRKPSSVFEVDYYPPDAEPNSIGCWRQALDNNMVLDIIRAVADKMAATYGMSNDAVLHDQVDWCIQALVNGNQYIADFSSLTHFLAHLLKLTVDETWVGENTSFDVTKTFDQMGEKYPVADEPDLNQIKDCFTSSIPDPKNLKKFRLGFYCFSNMYSRMQGAYPVLDLFYHELRDYCLLFESFSVENKVHRLQYLTDICDACLSAKYAPHLLRMQDGILRMIRGRLKMELQQVESQVENGLQVPRSEEPAPNSGEPPPKKTVLQHERMIWAELAKPRVILSHSAKVVCTSVHELAGVIKQLANLDFRQVKARCAELLGLDEHERQEASLGGAMIDSSEFNDNLFAYNYIPNEKKYDLITYDILLLYKLMRCYEAPRAIEKTFSDHRAFVIAVTKVRDRTRSDRLRWIINNQILVGKIPAIDKESLPLAKSDFVKEVRQLEHSLFESRLQVRQEDTTWKGWFRRKFSWAPRLGVAKGWSVRSEIQHVLPESLFESNSAEIKASKNREKAKAKAKGLLYKAIETSPDPASFDHHMLDEAGGLDLEKLSFIRFQITKRSTLSAIKSAYSVKQVNRIAGAFCQPELGSSNADDASGVVSDDVRDRAIDEVRNVALAKNTLINKQTAALKKITEARTREEVSDALVEFYRDLTSLPDSVKSLDGTSVVRGVVDSAVRKKIQAIGKASQYGDCDSPSVVITSAKNLAAAAEGKLPDGADVSGDAVKRNDEESTAKRQLVL